MSARSDGTVKMTVIGNKRSASGISSLFQHNEAVVMNKTIPVSNQLTIQIIVLNVFASRVRRRISAADRLGTPDVPLKLLVVA